MNSEVAPTDVHGSVNSEVTLATVHGSVNVPKALIVEDIRESEIELRERGYECDRITHQELLSSAGTDYTGKLLRGDYGLLWISTPSDWQVRAQKKATPHWQRINQ